MSEQSETTFDIEEYRYLGECSEFCKEHYLPRGRHEPNCESEECQALIDEIDRLNTALTELRMAQTSLLSEVRAFGRADENNNPITHDGLTFRTQPFPGQEEMGPSVWAIIPDEEHPGLGISVMGLDEKHVIRTAMSIADSFKDTKANKSDDPFKDMWN